MRVTRGRRPMLCAGGVLLACTLFAAPAHAIDVGPGAGPTAAAPGSAAGRLTTDRGQIGLAMPGQQLTLEGDGFAPSSPVQIAVDGATPLSTVAADATGALSLPVTLPPGLAVGAHTISATGTGPDGASRGLTLPVTVAPTILTSSGDSEQWTSLPVPELGWVALLDANGSPVTATTFLGQGTYTLDPSNGEITFQPLKRFYGTPRAATYQITDATGQSVTGTYQASVLPRAIPAVEAQKRTLTDAGVNTTQVGCSAGPVALSRCEVTLSTSVKGEQVTLASGRATAPGAGQDGTLEVTLTLTDAGKRLAGLPGGWASDVATSIWLPGGTEPLQVTGSTELTALNVTAPRPIRFASGRVTIPDDDLPYLNALRAHMTDVATVTCTGGGDDQGTAAEIRRVATRRARAVCDYLTARTRAKGVVEATDLTVASNATAAGRAQNRRTEIVFGYTPPTA